MGKLATNKVLELSDAELRAIIATAIGIKPGQIYNLTFADLGENRTAAEVRWQDAVTELEFK